MKLLTYAINKKELTGVLNREGTFVYPLSAAGMEYRTMKEVIREIGPSELELLDHISGLPPYEVSNAAPLEDITVNVLSRYRNVSLTNCLHCLLCTTFIYCNTTIFWILGR